MEPFECQALLLRAAVLTQRQLFWGNIVLPLVALSRLLTLHPVEFGGLADWLPPHGNSALPLSPPPVLDFCSTREAEQLTGGLDGGQ